MIKVWTNGCFDILHRGHIELFKYAKSRGDKLIVGVDSDKKVRKGKTQEELAQLLGISKGSINKIIKNEYSAYFLKRQNEEKTSNY